MAGKTTQEPIHPGEILATEFLAPLDLSQSALARAIGVPPRRVNEIVLGKRTITPDTAARLGRAFDISPQFWLNLQNRYDLERLAIAMGDTYAHIKALQQVGA